jgi:hypothetical protein
LYFPPSFSLVKCDNTAADREAPGGAVLSGRLGLGMAGSRTTTDEEDGMAKKKAAFGGMTINFKGCTDSLESVFGAKPVSPAEMNKMIWAYVKKKKLVKR